MISPEGYAAIFGRIRQKPDLAGEGLCVTAQHRFEEGIVDKIISESPGGSLDDSAQTARFLDSALSKRLGEAGSCSQEDRLSRRYAKLRKLGCWGSADQDD